MFEILNLTKTKPGVSTSLFEEIKNDILGAKYNLSLVLIGETRARRLNRENRKKNYVPNVLSFPYEKKEGEIFLVPNKIKREAKSFKMTPKEYCLFIFIHSCLHLKGLTHGKKMEKLEEKIFKTYQHRK